MTEHRFKDKVALRHNDTTKYTVKEFNTLAAIAPVHFNTYRVTICFMEGDADGYTYKKILISDEAILKEFVDFCFRCAVAYPHGKGGMDDYTHIEGYYRFVEEDDEDADEDEPVECLALLDGWPMHDWEWYTSFDWFKVEYFGPTGQAHTVEIITEA